MDLGTVKDLLDLIADPEATQMSLLIAAGLCATYHAGRLLWWGFSIMVAAFVRSRQPSQLGHLVLCELEGPAEREKDGSVVAGRVWVMPPCMNADGKADPKLPLGAVLVDAQDATHHLTSRDHRLIRASADEWLRVHAELDAAQVRREKDQQKERLVQTLLTKPSTFKEV